MSARLQEGIYYQGKPTIGNSFCILSLRSQSPSQIVEIGNALALIWKHLDHLKNGITTDLVLAPKHQKKGNLTTLLGYSSYIFDIEASKKRKPPGFANFQNFKNPEPGGGGPVIEGSGINYSTETFDNHLLRDHIIFQ